MDKRILRALRIIFGICMFILLIELGYFTYVSFFKEKKSLYFDSINAIADNDTKSLIVVGSNNNNDNHFERAKIAKYDSKKEKVFEYLYNKGYNGVFFDVVSDGDDYVAVGSFEFNEEEHEEGLRRALVVKYDKNGKILFDKNFKALDNSKFVGIYVVDDGYLVVGQSIYKNMTLGLSGKGGAYLIKLDKTGNIVWKSNYGDNKSAIFNDVIYYNNYIYVVGRDSSRVGIINKYDNLGNLVKSTKYEYTDNLGFTSIVSLKDGVVVAGAKKYTDGNNNSRVDALLVKYDHNGNYISEKSYESKNINRFNRIVKDSDNNLVMVGTEAVATGDGLLYNGLIGKCRSDLTNLKVEIYSKDNDEHFTDIKLVDNNYLIVGYSFYDAEGYLSKFIVYSNALKVLEVQ